MVLNYYLISANSNTILYKMLFTIDLDYMQKLKLLADNSQSVGCMICLYTCLYGRFEALKDRTPSVGCACPKHLRSCTLSDPTCH